MARFVEGYRGNKLAVTVLLVRDGAYGLEVYVQERVSSMPTFPKATVFPGGGVDPRDFTLAQPQTGKSSAPLVFEPLTHDIFETDPTWYGPSLSVWAKRLKTDRFRARALILGACRELFEESGTLLASHADGRLVADATPFHDDRLALESHCLSFSQLLLQTTSSPAPTFSPRAPAGSAPKRTNTSSIFIRLLPPCPTTKNPMTTTPSKYPPPAGSPHLSSSTGGAPACSGLSYPPGPTCSSLANTPPSNPSSTPSKIPAWTRY